MSPERPDISGLEQRSWQGVLFVVLTTLLVALAIALILFPGVLDELQRRRAEGELDRYAGLLVVVVLLYCFYVLRMQGQLSRLRGAVLQEEVRHRTLEKLISQFKRLMRVSSAVQLDQGLEEKLGLLAAAARDTVESSAVRIVFPREGRMAVFASAGEPRLGEEAAVRVAETMRAGADLIVAERPGQISAVAGVAPSGLAALVAAPLRSARPEARLLQGAFLVEYTTPPAGASLALEGEMELIRIFADNAATAIDNDMMVREIERMAVTDDLTGLYNRRYFNQELEREIVRSERTGKPFALLMADLDDFKRINDTYGHDAGDDVLRKVAQSMVAATRKSNLLARYGGEEFVSLLIESDAEGGLAAAERTRRAVEQIPGLPCRVTVSVGVAVFPQHARTMRELFRRADQALYAAKSTGRNQVRLAAAASHASATST